MGEIFSLRKMFPLARFGAILLGVGENIFKIMKVLTLVEEEDVVSIA